MSSAVGDNVPQNSLSDQRQIANQIQNLVAHELVWKAQRRIDDAVAGQNDRVLFGCAANQALLAHDFRFVKKTERPCRSDFRKVMAIRQFQGAALAANQRMWEIDGVGN